ncbi:MAG: type II toxin-antitoxin system RelE/ParE family toxin [Acetobacteraceae bacterium]
MKRRVVWADTARADYLGILRYIADQNPNAAERVAVRIETTAVSLGELATGRPGRVTGTYEKMVSGLPYILAYEIVGGPEGGEWVAILHVIHGARNWPVEEWPAG